MSRNNIETNQENYSRGLRKASVFRGVSRISFDRAFVRSEPENPKRARTITKYIAYSPRYSYLSHRKRRGIFEECFYVARYLI